MTSVFSRQVDLTSYDSECAVSDCMTCCQRALNRQARYWTLNHSETFVWPKRCDCGTRGCCENHLTPDSHPRLSIPVSMSAATMMAGWEVCQHYEMFWGGLILFADTSLMFDSKTSIQTDAQDSHCTGGCFLWGWWLWESDGYGKKPIRLWHSRGRADRTQIALILAHLTTNFFLGSLLTLPWFNFPLQAKWCGVLNC